MENPAQRGLALCCVCVALAGVLYVESQLLQSLRALCKWVSRDILMDND
eukprot:COSAG05_NODE_778_length_7403_cov_636.272180_7_plen_49_part_00